MNTAKLNLMLDAYYKDFEKNWIDEEYKWKEVEIFRTKFRKDCDPNQFIKMIKMAIDESSNLVASRNYYPMADLVNLAKLFPADVQAAINLLFDEDKVLLDRIEQYSEKIDHIKEKSGESNTAYAKDRRFISTLLYFRYPEKYTIYKYTEDRDFSNEYEIGIDIKKGHPDYINKAKTLVEIVAAYVLENRKDIIDIYKEKLKNPSYYQDENYLLLAQNIIWYATTCKYDVTEEEEFPVIQFDHGKAEQSVYTPIVGEKDKKPDYEKKAKESAKVGLSGESLVMGFEKKRLNDCGISKEPYWISQNIGDGFGYDILSYNEDGSKRYIEVKTTNGSEKTMFFITATELEACKKYGDDYYIYRVYKEKGEKKISWYRGKEVEALCNCPYTYAVIPN